MSVRNQNWYDYCSVQPYPLSDSATRVSDAGVMLPSNIIVDLNLRYPISLGRYAFLGSCVVTEQIVTVVLLASESETAAVNVAPLAAVSLVQPVDQFRQIALEPLAAGVGGWVVFGAGAGATHRARFSTPAQGLVLPRVARAYATLPIATLAKYGNATTLTGLVRLRGGSDIEIVKACREIPGYPPVTGQSCDSNPNARNVVVIRLKDVANIDSRNVLDLYRGPCGQRPESGTCGDPQPIEFLGPISPDCCGNITLELEGCVELSAITAETILDENGDPIESTDACGVLLECGYGLAESCPSKGMPDTDGALPGEAVTDDCSIVSITLDDEDNEPGYDDIPPCRTSAVTVIDNFSTLDANWADYSGTMDVHDDEMWCDVDGVAGSVPCIKIYDHANGDCLCSTGSVSFTLHGAAAGSYQNTAGLVFGYDTAGDGGPFYVAEVNWDGTKGGKKLFQVRYVGGDDSKGSVLHSAEVPWLQLGVEYEMQITINDPGPKGYKVSAIVLEPGTLNSVRLPAVQHTVQGGRWGLWSEYGKVSFNRFTIIP